jgi:ubiquinone biosynthesis protein COQ9
MPSAAPAQVPALALRDRLLDAMLDVAPASGWNTAAIAEAAKRAGLSAGQVEIAAPRGTIELIEAFADRFDKAMVSELAGHDLKAMKVRERVNLAVRTRIEVLAPHKEAARRSLARVALERNPILAGQLAWRTADAIWRALDDQSTDGNFYSKRALLAGVYAGTLAIWLTDLQSRRAWDFLAARIENVMAFEKFKATRLAPLGFFGIAAVGEMAKWRYREEPAKPGP